MNNDTVISKLTVRIYSSECWRDKWYRTKRQGSKPAKKHSAHTFSLRTLRDSPSAEIEFIQMELILSKHWWGDLLWMWYTIIECRFQVDFFCFSSFWTVFIVFLALAYWLFSGLKNWWDSCTFSCDWRSFAQVEKLSLLSVAFVNIKYEIVNIELDFFVSSDKAHQIHLFRRKECRHFAKSATFYKRPDSVKFSNVLDGDALNNNRKIEL